ncbi:MAG: phage tail protein [Bacteroidetes bacterium]|nr:MAG: phage tail protein [Bacteroidota bacterium]
MTYKTPGVYVQEISLFPPSVAQVETAIPAFVGYTEKALTPDNKSLTEVPVKIKSLVEFESLFGKGFIAESYSIVVDTANQNAVDKTEPDKRFYLYDAMRQFYDNGGGDCYIVSVGSFTDDIAFDALKKGFDALKKFDEPTLLLSPDAVGLKDSNEDPDLTQFAELQKLALQQCAELQNRFCILDVMQGDLPENVSQAPVSDFRDGIGINSLSYGAAYYPWIVSSYNYPLGFRQLKFFEAADPETEITNLEIFSPEDEFHLLENLLGMTDHTDAATSLNNTQITVPEIDTAKLIAGGTTYLSQLLSSFKSGLESGSAHLTNTTHYLNILAGMANAFQTADDEATAGSDFRKDIDKLKTNTELTDALRQLVEIEKNNTVPPNNLGTRPSVDDLYGGIHQDWFGGVAYGDITADTTDFSNDTAGSLAIIAALQPSTEILLQGWQSLLDSALYYEKQAERALFAGNSFFTGVMEKLRVHMRTLPPSAAIAGVYANTDRNRGVWKAPANISLNSVIGPAVKVDHREQESLNVHPTGKSINAIRTFTGKGTLVWGARTLAGNDNEWRYISVRRFFLMVEESTKKASAAFVFEPNDANTWVKVRSMIENFLTLQWRAGALQGATPGDAFFVRVGLGETMTEEDILEGRMIVEIGLAAVRPAEFIILRFSHKMQNGNE